MGSPHPVQVWCDHKNLTYFKGVQKLSARQARWQLLLSQYNLEITHKPERALIQADTLSRRPDHFPSGAEDKNQVVLLPNEMFVKATEVQCEDEELRMKIQEAGAKDPLVIEVLEAIQKSKVPPLRSALEDWNIEDGITRYKGRIYVPEDLELRREIVARNHDLAALGHPGIYRTQELVRRHFW